MTNNRETIHALLASQPANNELWIALAWCLGIMLVAYVLAIKGYRKQG